MRPAARNEITRVVSRRPRYPPERGCVRDARPCRSACPPMRAFRTRAWGCADGRWPPDTNPATAVPADWQALPGRRPRPKTLHCSRRRGPAWSPSARPLAGFASWRIRAAATAAPDDAGGWSSSRSLSSSVRPSVSSAWRVSPGRLTGSADHALSLISITTCATSAPREISQRHPRAPVPARTCLPRFALICRPSMRDYGNARGAGRAGRDDLSAAPAGRAAPRNPARRHAGLA
jgi:hypothetical protein